MGISKNRGTPKSSILIGFSTINHPFSGTALERYMYIYICVCVYHVRRAVSNVIACSLYSPWVFHGVFSRQNI